METTEQIWMNGSLIPWDDAKTHVLTHTLHYGAGVFEGIRAYETDQGPAIFRLQEHVERLLYSAGSLRMGLSYSVDEISTAIVDTLKVNKLAHAYIRPIAYYGYGKMGLNPKGVPVDLAIACWPWGAYLPHKMVDIKISRYIRIHPRSTVADAKICGHYVNSIFAAQELQDTDYHEALLLDFEGNIAEGPGENLFIVKDGVLKTPPLGNILAGITRQTVLEVAGDLGIKTAEEVITPDDAFNADEAFFTGTAAEVTPIRSIDDKMLGSGDDLGEVTTKIRETFLDLVTGKVDQYKKYLTFVDNL